MRTLFFILSVCILTSCTKDKVLDENHTFELPGAKGWTLVNTQGYDSYVGYYKKGSDKIHFDFGGFSFPGVDNIKQKPEMLYFEETVINGSDAKILKEKNADGTVLSVFIDKRDGKMTHLYTYNPKDDKKFISIFKSHKFR